MKNVDNTAMKNTRVFKYSSHPAVILLFPLWLLHSQRFFLLILLSFRNGIPSLLTITPLTPFPINLYISQTIQSDFYGLFILLHPLNGSFSLSSSQWRSIYRFSGLFTNMQLLPSTLQPPLSNPEI